MGHRRPSRSVHRATYPRQHAELRNARFDNGAFTVLAGVCFARGNADVVAMLARQLVRRMPGLDDGASRVRALRPARIVDPGAGRGAWRAERVG